MRTYFITGGTGFVGRALVREILSRDDTKSVTCLTRGRRSNALEHHNLFYWKGDITNCIFPKEEYTDIIHAAAEANDLLVPDKMQYYYDVVEGARRVFEWIESANPRRVLFASSGAVLKGFSIYCRAKRLSEQISPSWAKTARIFSLVGPEMPMNGQYALGKFIWQAVHNGIVRYYESGSVRSYLHVDDCARWLLTILENGRIGGIYDVGSEIPVSVTELAHIVARIAEVPCEEIKRTDFHETAQVYMPDIRSVRNLHCRETISFTVGIEEAINACRMAK